MSNYKKKKMGTGTKIVLVLCLIVFCGSGYYLADYYLKAHQAQSAFSDLKGTPPREKTEEHLADLAKLHQENSDIVGWLQVEGTKIDYPVMQTKGEGQDPEYYLHRDFKKEYSDAGTPFMDAASDINLPTSNWLIYGHHMRSGIMFHDLVEYESRDFWEKHPTFQMEMINGKGVETYRIIAACYSKVYSKDSNEFKYYQYAGISSEEDFNTYVNGVKSIAAYDTGESAVYGDQLVTLSTCAYQTTDGRFFVVGKRVTE